MNVTQKVFRCFIAVLQPLTTSAADNSIGIHEFYAAEYRTWYPFLPQPEVDDATSSGRLRYIIAGSHYNELTGGDAKTFVYLFGQAHVRFIEIQANNVVSIVFRKNSIDNVLSIILGSIVKDQDLQG
jgi:hypothetical protein